MNLFLWIALGFLANALWGATFPSSKYLVKIFDPITITAIRFSLSAIFLGTYLFIRNKTIFDPKLLKDSRVWQLSCIMYFLLYIAQTKGLELISSSFSSILMLTTPAFVWLIDAISDKSIDFRGLAFTMLSISISSYLIFEYRKVEVEQSALGISLTLIASFLLALSLIQTKMILSRYKNKNIVVISFHTIFIGSLFSLITSSLIVSKTQMSRLFESTISANFLFLSLVCSVFAFIIWNISVKKLGPITSGLLMTIKTPTAIVVANIYLGEALSLNIIFATFFLLILVLFNELHSKKNKGEVVET